MEKQDFIPYSIFHIPNSIFPPKTLTSKPFPCLLCFLPNTILETFLEREITSYEETNLSAGGP